MRAPFFTPTFALLFLNLAAHTYAQTPNAITKAEKTLAACPLTSDAPKGLLQQITSGYQGEPCLAKEQLKDSGPLSNNDPAALYDFAQAIWLQSMRNFLQTRLDAELRYRKNQNDPTPNPDVAALVNELCAQSATENVNLKVDRCRYSKVGNARALLLKSGQAYVAAFREAKVPSLSWNEAKTEINGRIQRISAYFEPVRALDPDQYPAKVDIQDSRVLHPKDGVTVRFKKPVSALMREQEEKNAAMAQYEALREFELRTGPGILLRAPALSKFSGVDSTLLSSPNLVGTAIAELKNGVNAAAGELNTDVAWAVGLDPNNKTKTPAPGWVSRMMIANPTAVGQVVAQNPAMAGLVCGLLVQHEQSEEINQAMMYTMHGMMWVTTLAGGVSLVPRLFAMQLGTRATANMLALQAVRTSFGRVGFGGLVGFDGAEQLMLSKELQKARRDLLVGTGVTEKTVAQKEQALSDNTATLAGDIAFLVIPKVTTLTPLGKFLTNTATTKQVAELTRFFRAQPSQIQASFEAFSLACSIVEERCAYVMAALHSATAKERLRIMASRQSMAAFIKEHGAPLETPQLVNEKKQVSNLTSFLTKLRSPTETVTTTIEGPDARTGAEVIKPNTSTALNRYAAAHEKKGIVVVNSDGLKAQTGSRGSFQNSMLIVPPNSVSTILVNVPVLDVSTRAYKKGKPGSTEAHEATHGETLIQALKGSESPRSIMMKAEPNKALTEKPPRGYSTFQQFDEIKTSAQDIARRSRGRSEAEVQAFFREGIKKDPNFTMKRDVILRITPRNNIVDTKKYPFARAMRMTTQTKKLTELEIKDLEQIRADPDAVVRVMGNVVPATNLFGYRHVYVGSTDHNYIIPLSTVDAKRYQALSAMRRPTPEQRKDPKFKAELKRLSEEFIDGLTARVKAGHAQAVALDETYRGSARDYMQLLAKENWTLEDYTNFRKAATAPANTINEFYKKEATPKSRVPATD